MENRNLIHETEELDSQRRAMLEQYETLKE
jgi:hypothetical protein